MPRSPCKKHNKYERNMFVLQGEFLRLTQDTDFKITMIMSKELMEVKEAINFLINLNSQIKSKKTQTWLNEMTKKSQDLKSEQRKKNTEENIS